MKASPLLPPAAPPPPPPHEEAQSQEGGAEGLPLGALTPARGVGNFPGASTALVTVSTLHSGLR